MRHLPPPTKIAVLKTVAFIIAAFAALFVAAVAQDPDYHNFADKRAWMGIPNFGDVAGNIFFAFAGLAGLWAVHRRRDSFTMKGEKLMWMVFFIGTFFVCFGSGYYHWAPSNETLVWDRAPMTIAFMSLFALMIMERVDAKAGLRLFPLFLIAGAVSVWYWHYTESIGHGDLRPYAYVQFFPMVAILLMLWMFHPKYTETRCLFHTLGWYMIAKILEHFDDQVFENLNGLVSGHTLKHIAAAIGVFWVVRYILARQPAPVNQN